MPVRDKGHGSRREASRLEHVAVVIGLWASAGAVVTQTLSLWWPVIGRIDKVTGPVFLVSLFLVFQHDSRLCVFCIRDAPTDGVVAAQRKRRWLWACHRIARNVRLNATALALYIAALVTGAVFHQRAIGTIAGIALVLLVIVEWHAEWVHRSLVVWCPWCKGRGKEEPSPEPTPSPELTKTGE